MKLSKHSMLLIVAFPGLTTDHQYAVCSPCQGSQDERGVELTCTGNMNHADVGGKLTETGQIILCPQAPVADENHDLGSALTVREPSTGQHAHGDLFAAEPLDTNGFGGTGGCADATAHA